MTFRKSVQRIVARRLEVKLGEVQDSTDISHLDPIKLQAELIQIVGYGLGTASEGWPKNFGDLVRRLNEIRMVSLAPRIEIRL